MKRLYCFFLLTLFLMGLFSASVQIGNFSYPPFKNTSEITTKAISNPISVSAKVYQDDPRGHLTGRMFYGGLDDTGGDSLFEQLLLEVEVDIAQTSTYGYTVFAEIQDRGFPHTNEWGDWDETYHLKGYSSIEDLSIGLHNITVAFNCTEMRALKLPGPFFVSSVELYEFTGSDFERFDGLWMDDHNKPLFVIYDPIDIETFDEPDDTYDLTFHDAILTGDFLEVNFTFQSFGHHYPEDRLYYIRLTLRNDTGSTIVHYQKTMVLSSKTVNDIVLRIPSEYLTAFKKHGGFAGNDYPIILFQEIAVVQINGDYGPFDSLNMSYTAQAYPTYNINVANAALIEVLDPGETYNFGTMNVNDTIDFIIYPESPNDILELQVNRIIPDGHDYEVYVLNGWGRFRNVNWGSAQFFIWSDWWDNTETEYLLTLMGKYMGPWRFFIHYPDQGGYQPPQGLSVQSNFFIDTVDPEIDLQTPTAGQSFSQYYGIPFKGQTSEYDSYIARYELICDSQVLATFDMMHGWGDPLKDDFSLVWFPPHDRIGNVEMTVRAIDLGYNIKEETITITIIPGTIPSPESTINKGLEWLRDNQNYDGSWNYYGDDHSAGMTALAALCFIQAGFAYESVVTDAIDFLKNSFEDDYENPGQVIRHMSPTYETAMATIALIAYNATLPTYDRDLDLLIDDAIDWIVATQNDEDHNVDPSEPWYGGWRYGWDHESSDLSVSQWVFLALAAYRYDDPDLWDKVQTFVLRCRGGWWDEYGTFYPDGGFTYTPSTEDWRDQGGSSYGSMTAAGIWGLYLSGTEPEDPYWEYIESALDWITVHPSEELVGQNPHYGQDFQYYWYLSASKAFLMAGRDEDQWWYDNITNFLCTHMVYDSSTSAYWDNEIGQEPAVFATVQAVLSQQVFYGHIPMHELEVSLEADDGCGIYLWNSTIFAGYNYTTGFEVAAASTTYSGLLEDKQTVSIFSPVKGEYFIDVFPAVGASGMSSPQNMILCGRALTESGHIISYKTEIIDYRYSGNYPQVLRYKMVLSTISGLDIHFLFYGYETFARTVNFNSINYPTYVELNEDIDITVTLSNIGLGTISTGTIFTIGDDFAYQSEDYTAWTEAAQKSFSFHYSTSGLQAGIRTIVIVLIGEDTTPLLIRVEVQVGNRAPVGELNDLDSVLSGTETISWTASDPDGDDLTSKVILILPDGTEVLLESSTDKTSYSFDTTAYPDDTSYQIIVEISDGTDTTRLQSSFFEIKNYEETEDTEAPDIGTPGFEFIFSFLTLGLIIIWFRRKK